jgi:hypothetical protein
MQVNTHVSDEIDGKLRLIAAHKKVSRSAVVRLALSEFISKYEVVSISNLPHPLFAEPVPLVKIKEVEG